VDPVYDLARSVAFVPLRHRLSWTIEGAHRLPPRGPLILAANHVSYVDPLALAYVAYQGHRRVRFLAKAELFAKPGFGALLRALHQVPVERGSERAAESLRAAADALARGECIAVFPEGTISPDLDPMVGKTGTARLAQLSGAPVAPVALWGAQRVLAKGRPPQWRHVVAETAVVGPPILVAPDEDVAVATDRIMVAIGAALRRAREIYPEKPGPDDDGWWARAAEPVALRSCRAEARA
jgi:1-acyl-sn-glycerol-3-phosphate acyltransferase